MPPAAVDVGTALQGPPGAENRPLSGQGIRLHSARTILPGGADETRELAKPNLRELSGESNSPDRRNPFDAKSRERRGH